jgi:CubicO group peptidase (beta-lactamase class C family)
MKKWIKRIFLLIVSLLIIASVTAVLTGNSHIFSAVAKTYLVGVSGPTIDDYTKFANRKVKAGNYHPWKLHENYNKKKLSDSTINKLEQYNPVAFLVIKDNQILFEKYWDNYSDSSYTNSFSMAKSITGILTGIAIDKGFINSVNDPVSKYLPQYAHQPKLTIKHLLTMSSGIDFGESYKDPFGFMAKAYYGTDIKKLTLSKTKFSDEPGKVFKYQGGNTLLLSFIIEQTSGMTLSEFASNYLWKLNGAKYDALWTVDNKNGVEKAYCCFYSNAQDFARFGRLFMQNGNMFGKQILTSEYVKESITPASYLTDTEGNKVTYYGYQWWLGNYKNLDFYFMRGILGQYVICIPSENIIIVRLGKNRSDKYINNHPTDVYDNIDAALEIIE